jgi:hypothetical protein
MTRKTKALSIAFSVIATMSIVGVASAQALQLHTTHQGNVTLTGQQTQQIVFTASAGNVVCNTVTFEGTVEGQGPQITGQETTLTPTLSGCQAFGLAATPKLNGCKLRITGKDTVGHTTSQTAWVDLMGCTAGKVLEANAGFGGCIITMGEQNHLSHVVFTNNAGTEDLDVSLTITGIKYELHGGLCGHPTTVVTNNGTLSGGLTMRAYKDTGTELVTQHGHQFLQSKHNNQQVGILAT